MAETTKYEIAHRQSSLSIGTLPSLRASAQHTATLYFNPSVGDHEGAKVASGPVCWS
jgi:hypothetical protein